MEERTLGSYPSSEKGPTQANSGDGLASGYAVKLSSTEDGCVVGMRLPLAVMAELLPFSHPRESGCSKSL